jgi:hypothetical protein
MTNPLTRANPYIGARHSDIVKDQAAVYALKKQFKALRDTAHATIMSMEYEIDGVTDFDGLLQDAWSDTFAIAEAALEEALGQ